MKSKKLNQIFKVELHDRSKTGKKLSRIMTAEMNSRLKNRGDLMDEIGRRELGRFLYGEAT